MENPIKDCEKLNLSTLCLSMWKRFHHGITVNFSGPYFPDGSINWQCDCMGGGSMVAHRCGHYFRRLYECMSKKSDDPNDESEIKCPKEFVSWAACIKGLSGTVFTISFRWCFMTAVWNASSHWMFSERLPAFFLVYSLSVPFRLDWVT